VATITEILAQSAPESIWTAPWPQLAPGEAYHPSPTSWPAQCVYQIMVDRFSDGKERTEHILQRDVDPVQPPGWRWNSWADSGRFRFQGGTIRGATSKLDYLRELGITAVWMSPVWKQFSAQWEGRKEKWDPYHGYAIQNFLNVDRRFGTRKDLADFVDAAHKMGIRVIMDIVINHTAPNWLYPESAGVDRDKPPYLTAGQYDFGAWIDGSGQAMAAGAAPLGPDDGVYPRELQHPDAYRRKGTAPDFGGGDPVRERNTDYENRDLALENAPDGHTVLDTMIRIWSYAIALYKFDGFRIDTLKHVEKKEARLFCAAVHEFADSVGMHNFLLAGEIGGDRSLEERYLEELGRDLDAALETGGPRTELRAIAEGRPVGGNPIPGYFARYREWEDREYRTPEGAPVATHRKLGSGFVWTTDDHDNIALPKLRLGVEPRDPQRCVVGVGLLAFLLGIPCLYYGTEQAMTGIATDQRDYLHNEGWNRDPYSDRYLREAMFGPEHPRKPGPAGIPAAGDDPDDPSLFDENEPGFAAFGAPGKHLFDRNSLSYKKVKHLLAVRAAEPALQMGRQYLRQLRRGPNRFEDPGLGDVLPWSRILARREILCVVNPSAAETRPARVQVCGFVNGPGARFTVLGNSAVIDGAQKHNVGDQLDAATDGNGFRYLDIVELPPASVLVLGN
jgi:glycosidase